MLKALAETADDVPVPMVLIGLTAEEAKRLIETRALTVDFLPVGGRFRVGLFVAADDAALERELRRACLVTVDLTGKQEATDG